MGDEPQTVHPVTFFDGGDAAEPFTMTHDPDYEPPAVLTPHERYRQQFGNETLEEVPTVEVPEELAEKRPILVAEPELTPEEAQIHVDKAAELQAEADAMEPVPEEWAHGNADEATSSDADDLPWDDAPPANDGDQKVQSTELPPD